MLTHNTVRVFAGALTMAICAFGQSGTPTPASTTRTSSLPPVGIGVTETVQVILTNTATSSSKGTAASCAGSVSFYNASGTMIGTTESFTLASGQIEQVGLPYASAGSTAVRALVRAAVSLTTMFPSSAPCALSYSLATFDTATGVTHAIVIGTGIAQIATPVFGLL